AQLRLSGRSGRRGADVALLIQAALLIAVFAGCAEAPPPVKAPPVQAPVAAPAPVQEPVADKDREDDMSISGSGVLGSLSDDQIQGPIQQRWTDIKKCKDQNKPPWYVGGQVQLHFRVARTGDIKKVNIEESTLGNWTIEKCILGLARTM